LKNGIISQKHNVPAGVKYTKNKNKNKNQKEKHIGGVLVSVNKRIIRKG
jgi:hypothetical protein